MNLKKLEVSNFRSIEHAEINFTPLSLIVGANAAGKSNLINVFRFIKDIITEGIDNAIALQGGTAYLSNVRVPKDRPIKIRFVLDSFDETGLNYERNRFYHSKIKEVDYIFSILPNKKGNGYRIDEDHLILKLTFFRKDYLLPETVQKQAISVDCELDYHKKTANSSYKFYSNFEYETEETKEIKNLLNGYDGFKFFASFANSNKKELMLNKISILFRKIILDSNVVRIFDFDPKELKKASSMVSTRILSEDGSNLASVLHEILRNKEKKAKLTALLKHYLPHVEGLSVESNIDKSFSYTINEKFAKRTKFHASFLSDGTVSIVALIIALYFEERAKIIILEEPERNIHPKLLKILLESAGDVSQEKQIIITTHNPEFLKHAKPDNVRFVSRDNNGNTIVTEPANSAAVRAFMEDNLGLDDLFLQDMLGD